MRGAGVLLLACLTSACLAGPAPAVQPAQPPAHVVATENPPPPDAPRPPAPTSPAAAADGTQLRELGAWRDASLETRPFTTLQWIDLDCDDPAALERARVQVDGDPRRIVWALPMSTWGNEGYALRDDAGACWSRVRPLIAARVDRTAALWTFDEPWDVAWSYWQLVDGVATYTPNRYNGIVTALCALVHADLPAAPCAVNVGTLAPGLEVPAGVDLLGVECYDPDCASKTAALERLTAAPIWLMPRAFVDGDPDPADAGVAAQLLAVHAAAKADARVTGLLFFLWCCDDTTTGARHFFAAGGARLPLTRAALEQLGAAWAR